MNLEIESHKIAETINDDIGIYQNYIVYEITKKNIDIVDKDVYRNRYTIDLTHFWYSNHEPEEENPLTFELRPCVYDKVNTDYYIEYRSFDIDKILDESAHVILLPDMTDWNDGTINVKTKHTYEKNDIYHIESSGFIDTRNYSYTGKNIVSIDNLIPNLADVSWLFSECFYAEDTSWFPILNTSRVEDMQYMFYHCARLRKLNLSEYNTTKVENTNHMFANCINMIKLDLSNFNLNKTKERNTESMFLNCLSLYELRLDNCNKNTINKIINSKNFPTNKITDEKIFEEVYNEDIINYNIKEEELIIHNDAIEDVGRNFLLNDIYSEYDKENRNLYIGYLEGKEKFRKIYCKRYNALGLTAPENWRFVLLAEEDNVYFNEITENLYIPQELIIETNDNLVIYAECLEHNDKTDNATIF